MRKFSEEELMEAEENIKDFPYLHNRLAGPPATQRDDEFGHKFDVFAKKLSFVTSLGDRIWLQHALIKRFHKT